MFLKILPIFVLICVANSAKILGLFPSPSISHQVVFSPYTLALADKGHEVVIVTTNPLEILPNKSAKYEQIDVSQESYGCLKKFDFSGKLSTFEALESFEKIGYDLSESTLASPKIQKLIERNKNFDLCIVEVWYIALYGLKDVFNCSLVLMSTVLGTLNNYEAFDNPTHPIVYPENNAIYAKDLNFFQRLHVTFFHVYQKYFLDYRPLHDKLNEKYLKVKIRPVTEIEKEADLLIVNGHPLISGIRPLVPNIIHMHNLHIQTPKLLPRDLEEILNTSKHGVIYFSFGSNIRSSNLSPLKMQIFMNVFKELPYTVLWKFETENLPNKPKNVHIFKWLPQQDVLAHPNIKLFITQGGLQSLEEAIDRGVPIIGIPFFGDQFRNLHNIERLGIGIQLDIEKLCEKILKHSILKVINLSRYRQNVKKLRDLMNDEPQKPLERIVWWTEYVLKYNGTKHLRTNARKVHMYQQYMLDVIAFVIVFFIFIFATLIYFWKCTR